MNSIELKKPSGETFVVYDKRKQPMANNFQTLSGYIDTDKSEMLLPTGFQALEDGNIETPQDRLKRKAEKSEQRNQKPDDSNMLLPAGIELEG